MLFVWNKKQILCRSICFIAELSPLTSFIMRKSLENMKISLSLPTTHGLTPNLSGQFSERFTLSVIALIALSTLVFTSPRQASAGPIVGYYCPNWGTPYTGDPACVTTRDYAGRAIESHQGFATTPVTKVYVCEITKPWDTTQSCPHPQKVVGTFVSKMWGSCPVLGDPAAKVDDVERSSCR